MAHFYTNIIRNNAGSAVVNFACQNTPGFLVTGGQVQAVTGGGDTEVSLVTGWRTEIQGETTTKHYTGKIPSRIKTAIFGCPGTTSLNLYFCSGGGAMESAATYTGSGRIDYDPPLETGYTCANPDIYIEENGGANDEMTLYLILVPPPEFS
jgi:hypothetical protein